MRDAKRHRRKLRVYARLVGNVDGMTQRGDVESLLHRFRQRNLSCRSHVADIQAPVGCIDLSLAFFQDKDDIRSSCPLLCSPVDLDIL